MSMRSPSGFIRPGFDPLKNPDAPTNVSASGGDQSASVSFTPPSNVGGAAVSAYYAVSNPGGITASGSSSPVSVTGLTNDTSYTFTVWALNTYGPGPYSQVSGSVTPGSTAVYAGGYVAGFNQTNVIAYIQINSGSNAIDFGDLATSDKFYLSSCSSNTRGIFAGGFNGGGVYSNSIEYITIASAGNAIDYGDLSGVPTNAGTGYNMTFGSGCSNQVRGIFGRGLARDSSNPINVINYLTIATTGTTSDFGDFTSVNTKGQSASGNSTRGVIALADSTSVTNYITIASAGDAINFGNLPAPASNQGSSSASNATFALFAAGGNNTISYVTIASTGSATDFGDLTAPRQAMGASSSSTKAIFLGGYNPDIASIVNIVDQVTISSTGNATDFGDLTQITYGLAACSNSHGGLQ